MNHSNLPTTAQAANQANTITSLCLSTVTAIVIAVSDVLQQQLFMQCACSVSQRHSTVNSAQFQLYPLKACVRQMVFSVVQFSD